MRDLEGKLALVTGGAKNVGKVIARRLAERGADVIINHFHSHEAAKQTKSELETTGSRVEIVRASVAQKHQVDQMFDEIEQKYGHLDILVNNAASGAFVPSSEVAEEHFARAIDTTSKEITATKTAREAAEQNLDAERKRYENGMTTIFQVLQIQQQLSDARVQELNALVGYNKAVTAYHAAVGDLLDVRNIKVEEEITAAYPVSRAPFFPPVCPCSTAWRAVRTSTGSYSGASTSSVPSTTDE